MSKREAEQEIEEEEDAGEWVGPKPAEAKKAKIKFLEFEEVYLENMPNSERWVKEFNFVLIDLN